MDTRLRLVNTLPTPRVLTLEPWGGEYDLAPGDEVEVRVEGLGAQGLEFEFTEEGITLTANAAGMDLTVFRAGEQVPAR